MLGTENYEHVSTHTRFNTTSTFTYCRMVDCNNTKAQAHTQLN